MSRKIVFAVMLSLLLIGTVAFTFNIQLVESEASVPLANDNVSRSSTEWWSTPTLKSFLRTRGALVDDDSVELVIGISDTRPKSYSELAELIVSDGGKLVNTISMDGRVAAVAADIPLKAASLFVTEVEISRLSRYVEPNVRLQADFTPNDPYWSLQWGPQKIMADWAWNTTTDNSSIIVAVVDTGIDYTHPDLAANYAPLGYDWVNNDQDPWMILGMELMSLEL